MALCCAASSVDPDATGALIVGDAMPTALADGGDAARGRALLIAHDDANCILCHAIADPAIRVSGSVGPALDGVGRRLSVGQLRLRVVDIQQVNAASAMPSYYRTAGLDRVADTYRGRPILAAAQVEDVVAYLATLK
jgi:sulfur-oxidizing protein SoxX